MRVQPHDHRPNRIRILSSSRFQIGHRTLQFGIFRFVERGQKQNTIAEISLWKSVQLARERERTGGVAISQSIIRELPRRLAPELFVIL